GSRCGARAGRSGRTETPRRRRRCSAAAARVEHGERTGNEDGRKSRTLPVTRINPYASTRQASTAPLGPSSDASRMSDLYAPRTSTRRSSMRIKYIIPFPFDDEGIANRAAQIPREILGADTEIECVPVRNSATLVDCYYEDLVFDMYITEAGLRAEEEGYDAVIMDTVSDSGMYALRSRLTIPVIGPGLVSYAVAIMLGKRFSIGTLWDKCR